MRVEDFINENRDKIVDVHWNETIQKYVKNLSLSQVLLNNLKKEEYFDSFSNFFENINNEIENYIKNAKNPTYQIAIVGTIKAGKSTLINALIGEDIASINVTPETATLTKFRYSKENYVKIKFYTKDEWNKIWENAQKNGATIFLNEYKELGAESIKNDLLGKKEEYKEFLDINELKKEVEKWTSSQSKEHYFVEEIEIGVENLNLPPQVCLVDTPGLDDIAEYRSKITENYIDSANAVLFCFNSKSSFSKSEMSTVARVFSKARYKKEQIYVLGTQKDILENKNGEDDWKKQKNFVIKKLEGTEYFETRKRAEEHIIGISSLIYPIVKKINIDNFMGLAENIKSVVKMEELVKIVVEEDKDKKLKIVEDLKKKLIQFSNIEKLEDIIKNTLLKDFNKRLLQDFIEKYKLLAEEIKKFRDENYKVVLTKKKEFELNSTELEKRIKIENEKIKKLDETNKRLKEKIEIVKRAFNNDLKEMENAFYELEKKIKDVNID